MLWYVVFSLLLLADPAVGEIDPPVGIAINANCATGNLVVHGLATKYGERKEATRDMPENIIAEFWANDTTGTWTIILIDNTREPPATCVFKAGRGFRRIPGEPV